MARSQPKTKRAPIQWADPNEVADWAGDLEEAWLFCRTYAHNWKPWTAHWSDELGTYEVSIRCNRCATRRVQRMSDKGAVLASHYEYPEGYLHAGMGRIAGDSKDVLRLESVTRLVTKQDRRKARRKRVA